MTWLKISTIVCLIIATCGHNEETRSIGWVSTIVWFVILLTTWIFERFACM